MAEEPGKQLKEKKEGCVVAFLGPKASYTHQATLQTFDPQDSQAIPLTTIEDVFAAVQSGSATHGVVPFENSSNGPVVFTLDLFADAAGKHADIAVCGEIYLPVRHCVLGHIPPKTQVDEKDATPSTTANEALLPRYLTTKREDSLPSSGRATPTPSVPSPLPPRVKPNHSLQHIKKLYSHPQAWGQCKTFLSTYLKGIERQDVSSTSRAAELVAADATGSTAAISSKFAAGLNGLSVLAEGVEDCEGNCTRFFILRRRGPGADADDHGKTDNVRMINGDSVSPGSAGEDEHKQQQRYKTLLSFTVDHSSPGALADSLAVFKKHGLNLTSINTRPSGASQWNYIFFIELMGWKREVGEGGAVNAALEDLGRMVRTWRWLGSWEKAGQEA